MRIHTRFRVQNMACSKVSINFHYDDKMYLLSYYHSSTWISHSPQVSEGQGQHLQHLIGIQHLVKYQAHTTCNGCSWNLPTNESMNEGQFSGFKGIKVKCIICHLLDVSGPGRQKSSADNTNKEISVSSTNLCGHRGWSGMGTSWLQVSLKERASLAESQP